MKIPRFSNAIGNLDEDLVEAAAECKKKQNHLLKLGSIAACFAVIIVVGALVLPSLLGGEPTPGGTNDRYKDINIMAGESEIEGDRYTEKFEVYQLKYADKSQLVAVRMEGSCYTFKRDNYEPPHTLGELPPLLMAHVAGRRADKLGDRVLFHIFGHVHPDQRALGSEHGLRQGLGQLRLAHAGGA